MANYEGYARSNYVQISTEAQMEALKKALEPFSGISIHKDNDTANSEGYCLLAEEYWPSSAFIEDEEGNEIEIEFSWEGVVMPHIDTDQVLVVMEVGHEKLRYLVGYAEAYVRKEDGNILSTQVSISDIYNKAADLFGIGNISAAEY